ncbi:MAG TPA: peptidylprolyl isomerase [Burkholderiaceae bacterium]|jgi:peptidylprolyl isomerase|nr:peptidylprolyl isomerase [Burkholderiaceae bacterium]
MRSRIYGWIAALPALALAAFPAVPAWCAPYQSIQEIIQSSVPSDWRTPDPENILYMDLPGGRVVIELAPAFAPRHVANLRALARERYFDGLSVNRAQDNYVVQWGDPDQKNPRPIHAAKAHLSAEFDRPYQGLAFNRLPEGDVYAPQVGFSDGFPAALDVSNGRAWLTHCYGMVGAGRDNDAASGGGTELYAVIGHAPRHLDRNVTLVGRVLLGIELLSSLPRGTAEMGFYESAAQRLPIRSVRVAADLPAAERVNVEVMRTDTAAFARIIESRRNRRDDWTKVPAGHIELCNVPLAVRVKP